MNECKRDEYMYDENFYYVNVANDSSNKTYVEFCSACSFNWNEFFSVVFSFVEVVGFSLVP